MWSGTDCPAYIQGFLKRPCNRQVNRNSCRSPGQSVGSRRTLWNNLLRSLRVLGKRRPKGHSGLASDRGETEHDLFSFYFNFVPELLKRTERKELSFMSLNTSFPVLTFPGPASFPCTLPPRVFKHTLNMSLQKSPYSMALEHLTLREARLVRNPLIPLHHLDTPQSKKESELLQKSPLVLDVWN